MIRLQSNINILRADIDHAGFENPVSQIKLNNQTRPVFSLE